MLTNAAPPRASLDVLSAELTAAARDGRLDVYLDQRVTLSALSVTAAHPLFALDIEAISADDDAPPASRLTAWRYLLEVDRRVVAQVSTVVDPAGSHHFGGIGTGPPVTSLVYAVHILDALLGAELTEFTFGGLDVAALHAGLLQASDANGRVFFLPVGLATALHPARLYSLAEVRATLREMATRIQDAPVRGEPVGG
jgi:hypothetical protein